MNPFSPITLFMQESSFGVVKATGEDPLFRIGEAVKVSVRFPVGHYRVPLSIRGRRGSVEMVIKPMAVNNEEEGFGRNAGMKGHYYRVAFSLAELWSEYTGSAQDNLHIEIFENWLERI
jgi:nitrile hydratase